MTAWISPPAAAATSGHRPVVRVVSPAGPVDRARLERSLAHLEARGFSPRVDEAVFCATDYLAGDDARRLGELQAAFAEPEVEVVWATRGGYGTLRLLANLDLGPLLAAPKIIAGFSDLSALHAALNTRGLTTLHSCVLAGLAELGDTDEAALFSLLAGETPAPLSLAGPVIAPGRASGRLLGGNLSVLTRLLGTPYLPALDGALLLIEDVGERPYRLDRMLTHLELSGAARAVAGVVVGELRGCVPATDGRFENPRSALGVVGERLSRWDIPVMAGAPIGHGRRNRAVALGPMATLDTETGSLRFEGPAFVRR